MNIGVTLDKPLDISIIDFIADNIEMFMRPFAEIMDEISLEIRPRRVPFHDQPPMLLKFIIEELIKREILTPNHLKVLLPETTLKLTCDENREFTPYQPDSMELILKRCKDLEVLHYHYFQAGECEVERYNAILRDSIPVLTNLRVINFYDAKIEDETLKVISLNCRALQSLNLHKADVSESGIEVLLKEESVVKCTLRTLIIDHTNASSLAIALCLVGLKNLEYFISDVTLYSCFRLFKYISVRNAESDDLAKYKTTVLKHSFETHGFEIHNYRTLTIFSRMFSNVNHLILTSIQKSSLKFTNKLIPLMNITSLELSADVSHTPDRFYTFRSINRALTACGDKLSSLKLEMFEDIDLISLSRMCKNLKNLFLINNTYNEFNFNKTNIFEELIELQVIMIKNHSYGPSLLQLTVLDLYTLLSSKLLKKLVIYLQVNLSDTLIGDLLEGGHLQNLNELFIYHCNEVTEVTIWQLINTGKIEKVELGFSHNFTENVANMLKNYIIDHKLDISLSRVIRDPYFLRWSVVDLPITGRETFNIENSDFNINRMFE